MHLSKNEQSLLGFASLLLGFFFIILLKANGVTGSQPAMTQETVARLIQNEQENQQLSNGNEKIKQELVKYDQGQNAFNLANEQLKEAKMNAGLIGVTGPGVRITQDDSKRAANAQEDSARFIVHEKDIRGILNALWNGGAEAIVVNGQRVTTNTEVFCSGVYIQINGTQQRPPYVIEAIGDTNILSGALKFYGWDKLGDLEQQLGITRKPPEVLGNVVIPAGKPRDYHFAKPTKEGT